MANLLNGITVVVTRPRAQGNITAQCLEDDGIKTISYPVLDIQPLPPEEIERRSGDIAAKLATTRAIIFISANAVTFGMPILQHWRGFPSNGRLYGIGKITADALKGAAKFDHHWQIDSPSSGNDSEALLAMSALQDVAGQHIIIVCGHSETGGRKELQQTLRERGAEVSLLICYERKAISASAAEQSALLTHLLKVLTKTQTLTQPMTQPMTFFLALSVETLDSLMDNIARLNAHHEFNLVADTIIMQQCILLVSHRRVAEAARQRGWQHCEVVPMNNEALAKAIAAIVETARLAPTSHHQ